jgi:AcrR family transcriptional regulator
MADAKETRQRILDIALELFGERGFAGTSVADIAGRLGTSKAALYYHFRSKAEIAEALLAGPMGAYTELMERAPGLAPEELLGAVVDTTAELYALTEVVGNDPSIQAAVRDHVLPRSKEINETLTAALVVPDPPGPPGRAAGLARAHAAYSVAKHGTLAAMTAAGGRLDPGDRAELVEAALRALSP